MLGCVDAHHEYMWFVAASPSIPVHVTRYIYFLIILTLVVASPARMAVCVYMRYETVPENSRFWQRLCALLPLSTFYYQMVLRDIFSDHRSTNIYIMHGAADSTIQPWQISHSSQRRPGTMRVQLRVPS